METTVALAVSQVTPMNLVGEQTSAMVAGQFHEYSVTVNSGMEVIAAHKATVSSRG